MRTVGTLDLRLSKEDIAGMGVDPDTVAVYPSEDGGGYQVGINYVHQLHCVVSLLPFSKLTAGYISS